MTKREQPENLPDVVMPSCRVVKTLHGQTELVAGANSGIGPGIATLLRWAIDGRCVPWPFCGARHTPRYAGVRDHGKTRLTVDPNLRGDLHWGREALLARRPALPCQSAAWSRVKIGSPWQVGCPFAAATHSWYLV